MKLGWLCTILLVAVACGVTTTSGPTQSQNGGSDGSACVGPLGPPIDASQLSSMTACCQADMGDAHCLAASSVPSELQTYVATCDSGGYCIPDNFLETGGSVPPQTCSAFGGSGVCLSVCIPQVAMNRDLLSRGECQGLDELCAPCINPINGSATGACDIASFTVCAGDAPPAGSGSAPAACDDPSTCVYDADCPPVIDPSSLVACGSGGDAHCIDASFVTDPTEASQLAACPTDATKLCVPDLFLETGGKFIPKTCTSVNGNEGRCLSEVLPEVQSEGSLLPQDVCAASERCAPCFSPIDGSDTGACHLSCDPGPTTAAIPFASCCSKRALCVPSTSVPSSEQSDLDRDSCDKGDLCVPTELVENDPIATCTANGFIIGQYDGVCLSDCLDFGIEGIALAQGNCGSHETCAPCTNPLSGDPTGAPGCPGTANGPTPP